MSNNDHIRVRGAREHNLQGIDVDLPRDSLIVVTGLSGSGKSSLAFDTIYQEGQRRFMESLSAYARQFLGRMEKPQVERVEGLSPTLCIDQKTVNRNPRSTVGTITEILDHLRLLMARLGQPHCPVCQRPIQSSSPGQMADAILREHTGARLWVLGPIVQDRKGEYRKELASALADGYLRARIDGELQSIEEPITLARYEKHTIELVCDRLRARPDMRGRLVEALEHGLRLGKGVAAVLVQHDGQDPVHMPLASDRMCPEHGIAIPEMEPRLFSFNAPQGMCTACLGIGWQEDFDPDLLIDADAPFDRACRAFMEDGRLPFSSVSVEVIQDIGARLGITPGTLFRDLEASQQEALLYGADLMYTVTRARDGRSSTSERQWSGVAVNVRHVWHYTHLKRLEAFRRRVHCTACDGARLNEIARAVLFRDRPITWFTHLTISDARAFFKGLRLAPAERQIGTPLIREIQGRLGFLEQVGLGYLSLDRSAATLSGGEGQRIRLASQVGAGLQGVTYVLDEPSIGLHGRDQARLLDALIALRDKGNTVIVVEHDPATMARADYLLEVGPGAGVEGGRLMAAGTPSEFRRSKAHTAAWLRGEATVPMPQTRRMGSGQQLHLSGARGNNLQGVDLQVPLGTLTVVTGVSGSGKSTVVHDTLYKALAQQLHGAKDRPAPHQALTGVEHIDKVVVIDQAPIGRTPRSNPATYTKAWEPIRTLFSRTQESRARGYKKGRFSFNVAGGRCEECQGAGIQTVEMQFLADVQIPCEACESRRFNQETLEIRYRGRTITDILRMPIADAARFFKNHRKIRRIMDMLVQVGLGYVHLGQPSTTLSGGEAQRIKLASELARPSTGRTLYILDEPTTGLHMADVARLLEALQALVEAGNTVLVIEHDLDMIKAADHLIDLGPDGGVGGGQVVGTGTPETVALLDTPTARVLAPLLLAEGRIAPPAGTAMAASPPAPWRARRSRRRAPKSPTIQLRGVKTHNLRDIDLDLPQGKLTVITGPSGSGKTSLAFHTLFSEGQRRYVESLSTYARRFLGRMQKPPIDSAEGLAPAIAIDQRNRGHNPRSTVATVTEAYDTIRLLFARIGHEHCPTCAQRVRAISPTAAGRILRQHKPGPGRMVCTLPPDTPVAELVAEGFTRGWDADQGTEIRLEDLSATQAHVGTLQLVVDRFDPEKIDSARAAEATAAAYGWGDDRAVFWARSGVQIPLSRSPVCPQHGRLLSGELTPRHFSFNSHWGACPACTGLGRRTEIDPALVFPHPKKPLEKALDGRVAASVTRGPRKRAELQALFDRYDTPRDARVCDWPPALRKAVLYGSTQPLQITYSRSWGRTTSHIEETRTWGGICAIVDGWKARTDWLRQETTCSACEGGRLRPEILAVTMGWDDRGPDKARGMSIADVCRLTVTDALAWWSKLMLTKNERTIAEQAKAELLGRLHFLQDVGLGYLSLDRAAETLSGGEAQRIRLATQLGSRLTGTIYVLDEPTIGLHPRDTRRLMGTLRGLRDLGNTLVVVEHDPDVIRQADHVVDMGPGAGEYGGQVVAQGPVDSLIQGPGLTADYLSGRTQITPPGKRRKPKGWVRSPKSEIHNLQGVTPRFARGVLTVVTGVSGSGKSSLVLDSFVPWVAARIQAAGRKGDPKLPKRLVVVDQRPIGRTPRSCPATYCDIFTPIRTLFAATALARERGWKPGRFHFSGNNGGKCSDCEGRGAVLIEMHFLSDVWVPCDACGQRRYNAETLEVRWKGLSIADVLELPAAEALPLFQNQKKVHRRLQALVDVGLGYVRLGQPANTLSGGEAQRMKLAQELYTRRGETCFVLDEPTTGLHLADVDRLLGVLHALVDQGHMVVVIEHHLDVIRSADQIIDMGPEGGTAGGQELDRGTPEAVARRAPKTGSWTALALASDTAGA